MPRVKLFDENEILYKAMELFWQKGYHATSIQDMVNYLGINRGSLYDTFGGKKNLFDKALELSCSINQDKTIEFLNQQKSVKEGIKKFFELFIGKEDTPIDTRGCFVVNTINEFNDKDEYLKEALSKNRDYYETVFYDFLLRGQQNGEISKDKDIKTISFLIYTLYNGIKVVSKLEKDNKKILASVDCVLKLLD